MQEVECPSGDDPAEDDEHDGTDGALPDPGRPLDRSEVVAHPTHREACLRQREHHEEQHDRGDRSPGERVVGAEVDPLTVVALENADDQSADDRERQAAQLAEGGGA